jgi:hypothetical protein
MLNGAFGNIFESSISAHKEQIMKRIVLSLMLGLMVFSLQAQSANAEIKSEFNKYWEYFEGKDFDKMLDMIHPGLFELVPKSMMLEITEQTFNSDSMEMRVSNNQIKGITEINKIEGVQYAKVEYGYILGMKFGEVQDAEEADFMVMMLEMQFGEGNVAFSDGFYDITMDSKMVAINDPEFGSWKFLEVTQEQMMLLENLVPAEILSEFK